MTPPVGYNRIRAAQALMPQDRYQTRLPTDDAERVDDYAENHDISESEAVRRLIRAGLNAEAAESDGQLQRAKSGPLLPLLLALVFLVLLFQVLVFAGVTL